MKSKLTLSFNPPDDGFRQVVMLSRIVSLYKADDGELTVIQLDTGDQLLATESINTLEAKINSDDD